MEFLKKQFVYKKVNQKIQVEIKAISSMKQGIPQDVAVQWVRGSFIAETKPHSFIETRIYKGEASRNFVKKI